MSAVSNELDEPTPNRSILFQIAVTILVGIPMTLALVIALVVYCTYECLKFAFSHKSEKIPEAQNPSSSVADEMKFTDCLATFANIHGVPQKVDGLPQKVDVTASKEANSLVSQSK